MVSRNPAYTGKYDIKTAVPWGSDDVPLDLITLLMLRHALGWGGVGWGSDDVPLDLITLLDSTIKSARKTFIYTYIYICLYLCIYIYIDIWIRMHIDILTSLHAEMSKSLLKMELNSRANWIRARTAVRNVVVKERNSDSKWLSDCMHSKSRAEPWIVAQHIVIIPLPFHLLSSGDQTRQWKSPFTGGFPPTTPVLEDFWLPCLSILYNIL